MAILKVVHLVLVDASTNHNKEYRLTLEEDDGLFAVSKAWGRVGAKQSGKREQFGTRAGAEDEFNATLRDLLAKGYKQVELAANAVVKALAPQHRIHPDERVARWVTSIRKCAGMSILNSLPEAVSGLPGLPTGLEALASVFSATQVATARKILHDFHDAYLKIHRGPVQRKEAVRLAEQYYSAMPSKLPTKLNNLPRYLWERFAGEETRLDTLDATLAASAPNLAVAAPTSMAVAELGGTLLERLPNTDPFYRKVVTNFMNTAPGGTRVIDLIRITIPTERSRFEDCRIGAKYRASYLWHGTKPAILPHILRQGLLIPKVAANGRRFGAGIYLAESVMRSANYTGPNQYHDATRAMLLCRVKLGKPKVLAGEDSTLTRAPAGYDSVRGTGSYSGIDEFVVYSPAQVTIEAVILFYTNNGEHNV